jgi:hypothetical protein
MSEPPPPKNRKPPEAAKLRGAEADSSGSVNDPLNFSTSKICRIILRPLQAARLKPLLDESKARGSGSVLGVITQYYDASAGGTVFELQAYRFPRSVIRKIEKILRSEIAKGEGAL